MAWYRVTDVYRLYDDSFYDDTFMKVESTYFFATI